MLADDERRHLETGPRVDESPGGAGVISVAVSCDGHAERLLDGLREVMSVVAAHQDGDWPPLDRWRDLLPAWFVEACAPERSPAETDAWLERWRALPPAEQRAAEQAAGWSLADWLFWLEPDERRWFWWDGATIDSNTLRVDIEVAGWPAPLGALDWLVRTCGGTVITVDGEAV